MIILLACLILSNLLIFYRLLKISEQIKPLSGVVRGCKRHSDEAIKVYVENPKFKQGLLMSKENILNEYILKEIMGLGIKDTIMSPATKVEDALKAVKKLSNFKFTIELFCYEDETYYNLSTYDSSTMADVAVLMDIPEDELAYSICRLIKKYKEMQKPQKALC